MVGICRCDEFTADFRYCDTHHAYMNGTVELTSVSRVISSIIPYEPRDRAAADNAQERGTEVDEMFSQWLIGNYRGTEGYREDAIELFKKAVAWWNSEDRGQPIVQQIVQDGTVAGRYDLKVDGVRYDLKCTYDVSALAPIQLAAYDSLDIEKCDLKVIHVTKRYPRAKIVDVPKDSAMKDWNIIRDAWTLKRRLNGGV